MGYRVGAHRPGAEMWVHLGRAPIDGVRSEGPGGGRVELVPTQVDEKSGKNFTLGRG